MNELTATSPSAPVDGATRATSVTCTDDQSMAVPSARPKLNAIAPSNNAPAGRRIPRRTGGPPADLSTVLTGVVDGIEREIDIPAIAETTLTVTSVGMTTPAPPAASRAMRI